MRHQQNTHGRDRYPNLKILIPARAGSVRIPRKNLQQIVPGKSLLQWCIEFYHRCLPGVPIIVATEDHETSKQALGMKCQLHGRCIEDIQDTRSGYGVLADVLDCYPNSTVMLVQCTSPFTFRSEVERGLTTALPYVSSGHTTTLHTLNDGCAKSQEIGPTTILTGNFAIARAPFANTDVWVDPSNVSQVGWLSAIDINVQEDLDLVKLLAKSITIDSLLEG